MKKRHKHLLLTAFLIAATTLVGTGCDLQNQDNTLLTAEGRRELGISQLRVQCQPNNNGLSIRFKYNDVITFFATGKHYTFRRAVNDGGRTISADANSINHPGNRSSALQLTNALNAFCSRTEAVMGQNHKTEAPTDIPPGVVYQLNETGTSYTANQAWNESALKMLEDLRKWSKSLRAEQSARHKAAPLVSQQGFTLNQ